MTWEVFVLRRTVPILVALLLAAGLVPAASAGATGSYIVVLRDGSGPPGSVAREHARAGARVDHVYSHALNGYSATMSEAAAAQISNDPRVKYVEADGEVTKAAADSQSPATWGLDRIDQRALPLNSTYSYGASGAGVTAYIIDSGVSNHSDFGGRLAATGVDYVDDDTNPADCDGHGTHVAGTIGSETYGVAQDVTLVGVRVLNCSGSGSWSDVIAGIDWVTANHTGPSVANMSLGGGANTAVDEAIARSTASGVVYAVAAGNGNSGGKAQDACGYSPARAASALTVGATNSSDTKASWSNYGTCVDLFAPGVGITSTVMGGGTESWSGTSMATPHVAGAAALYLELAPTALPGQVADAITGQATAGVVSNAGTGSPNLLLYSLLVAGTQPPANAAPTVAIDSPAGGSTVSGTVVVSATAADADGNVSAVDFYADGATTPFGTDTDPAGGWTAAWDSASVANGSHTVKAVATDNGGATGTGSVTVTVDNVADPLPGTVLAVNIAAGQSTKKGPWYTIPLTVTVTDGVSPISGATVALSVLNGACPGTTTAGSGSATTGLDGTVVFSFKSRSQATYCAEAAATKDGYSAGIGTATFST